MKLKILKTLLLGGVIVIAHSATAQAPVAPGGLRAGAARVDITPAAADLPAAFKSIHDPIYVRALVLDNGTNRAAIVVAEAPTFAPAEEAELTRRIAAEIRAPIANVLLAVSHNHNAVRIDHAVQGNPFPASLRITDDTMAATLRAVKGAQAALQPAQAGYAEGTTVLLGRRPQTGPGNGNANAALPPDATLGVFEVSTLTGEPIAFLMNSGLEPAVLPPFSVARPVAEVSGDVAGVAARYIEQRYADKPVVLYTVGAISTSLYSARRLGSAPPADPHVLMSAMGDLLGEDVLATAAQIRPSTVLPISGAISDFQCPGKLTTPLNAPPQCTPGSTLAACVYTERDASPVRLQVGVLRLGDLTLAQADANITQPVWQRLKRQSPAPTALISRIFGPVRYVAEDAAYPTSGFEVRSSAAMRGCAADGFVNGILRMSRPSGGPGGKIG